MEARLILGTQARLAARRIDEEELEDFEDAVATNLEAAASDVDRPGSHAAHDHRRHDQRPTLLALIGSITKLALESRRATANVPGQAMRAGGNRRAIREVPRRHALAAPAEAIVERAFRRPREEVNPYIVGSPAR